MTLLIDIRDPAWMTDEALKVLLQPHLPGVEILCGDPGARGEEVRMLAGVSLFDDSLERLPNLELVQKLGAGVDGILRQTGLDQSIRVCRLKPDAPAREITEYCLAYVLQRQRHLKQYAQAQGDQVWRPAAPRKAPETRVGVLGLGHIGGRIAGSFAGLDYQVDGWSRSQKRIEGVTCLTGEAGLATLLGRADYVISILPSTEQTRGLFHTALFRLMNRDAILINVGRGDAVVDEDLLNALDEGVLAGAVLDVFNTEPLPKDHPFWGHARVTITPHVSGWHIDGGLNDIAENYHRLVAGEPLLHEVDRNAGY